MDKIKIITDSTCDLSREVAEELGIEVVPLSVNINSKSYRDGIDITFDALNNIILETEDFPTTSPVTPDVFKDVYEKYLDRGYKIISIHISSKVSATYQSAFIARDILDTKDIFIYDTMNVSCGIGLIAYEAAQMVKDGYSLGEICSCIEEGIASLKSCVVMNNLTNLIRAGRVNKTVGTLGSILGIKPVIGMLNGEIALIHKIKGTKGIYDYLVKFIDDHEVDQDKIVWILYSKGAIYLDAIKKYLDDKGCKYVAMHVGCVIGCYSGEKCMGIFIKKKYRKEN